MHRFHRQHHARHGFGWAEHGPRGPRGLGRHGRPDRVFEQGDLRLVLLKLIADKPRHGYELIKAVEEAVGGAYAPSPGVVYPALTLLEDMGYAKAQAEANRLLTGSLNQTLVNYRAVDKWNGVLPTVTSGATPFIDLRKP